MSKYICILLLIALATCQDTIRNDLQILMYAKKGYSIKIYGESNYRNMAFNAEATGSQMKPVNLSEGEVKQNIKLQQGILGQYLITNEDRCLTAKPMKVKEDNILIWTSCSDQTYKKYQLWGFFRTSNGIENKTGYDMYKIKAYLNGRYIQLNMNGGSVFELQPENLPGYKGTGDFAISL